MQLMCVLSADRLAALSGLTRSDRVHGQRIPDGKGPTRMALLIPNRKWRLFFFFYIFRLSSSANVAIQGQTFCPFPITLFINALQLECILLVEFISDDHRR